MNQPILVDTLPTYTILSVRCLSTDKQKFLSLFSKKAVWLLCLNKNCFSVIKKFNSINQNFQYKSYPVFFSNPTKIRVLNENKKTTQDLFWVEKRFRDSFYKSLNIIHLPLVMIFIDGDLVYSAPDIPSDFLMLKKYKQIDLKPENSSNEMIKKISRYKEQVKILKKTIKKLQNKEIDYKTEITEIKSDFSIAQREIIELNKKIKELEIKTCKTPNPIQFYNLPVMRTGLKHIKNKIVDELWNQESNSDSDLDAKDLDEINGSKDFWINSLGKPNALVPIKLKPIHNTKKRNHSNTNREDLMGRQRDKFKIIRNKYSDT